MEYCRAHISYCLGGKGVKVSAMKDLNCDKILIVGQVQGAKSFKIITPPRPVDATQRLCSSRNACEHRSRQSRCNACRFAVPPRTAHVEVTLESGETQRYNSAIDENKRCVLTDGVNVLCPYEPTAEQIDRPRTAIGQQNGDVTTYTVVFDSGKTETAVSAGLKIRLAGCRWLAGYPPTGIPIWEPITRFEFEINADGQKVYNLTGARDYSTNCRW